jgi:hypothetical protein
VGFVQKKIALVGTNKFVFNRALYLGRAFVKKEKQTVIIHAFFKIACLIAIHPACFETKIVENLAKSFHELSFQR